ncbi:Hypothetical predicted protein [Olea europaea subsp. europaea]|uniref:Uncharacterized protein n=1 Tax=Olea europaea subsp. europaea TaxID=158383 RepID=A0A8S0QF99_OLEEU|nr:Hypothetical predicted protein [Olea europaea subsp. europaea]
MMFSFKSKILCGLLLFVAIRNAVAQKSITKEKKQRKRSRQKKLMAYDLSSLSDFLPEMKAPKESRPAEFKLNSKTRNNLVLKESNQLKTVINHPTFQSDPLGAIYQHLQSTQPAMDEKPKRKDRKTRKMKAKGKKSKALCGTQSMEI